MSTGRPSVLQQHVPFRMQRKLMDVEMNKHPYRCPYGEVAGVYPEHSRLPQQHRTPGDQEYPVFSPDCSLTGEEHRLRVPKSSSLCPSLFALFVTVIVCSFVCWVVSFTVFYVVHPVENTPPMHHEAIEVSLRRNDENVLLHQISSVSSWRDGAGTGSSVAEAIRHIFPLWFPKHPLSYESEEGNLDKTRAILDLTLAVSQLARLRTDASASPKEKFRYPSAF